MTNKEVAKVLDGEAWIEYEGNLYEHTGQRGEKHEFTGIEFPMFAPILVSERALRLSSEFYYTEKY